MTATTIKVPKATRDRLHRLAATHGLTLAQEIDRLIDESGAKPRPTIGGYRSTEPLSADRIDAELARGFGE
ncbi:antitoxin [Nocardia sp. NBC_01377]|uniref:antitoxin n=1 Tax=Nocardia TaxID=1817 RepID=UPI001C2146F9|nr:antitoxin [Nocardia noduli]